MLTRHAAATALLTGTARLAAPLTWGCHSRMDDAGLSLFLTFDDGPHPEVTPRILEALAERNLTATFFVVGERAAAKSNLTRRINEAGHTVGQHTYTHIDPWRSRPAAIESEMERATSTIEDLTGSPVTWMRPPFGHVTPGIVRWAKARGQSVALWDLMPGDFLRTATAENVARYVEKTARAGSIIVLHDSKRTATVTPDAVGRILRSDRLKDYRFAPL